LLELERAHNMRRLAGRAAQPLPAPVYCGSGEGLMTDKRKRFNKIATIILFGFLVLSFGLWGIGDIFRGSGRTVYVASVGEVDIPIETYANALQREVRRIQQALGQSLSRDEIVSTGIAASSLAQVIQDAWYRNWADDQGLVITREQVLAEVRNEPAFQANGAFSPERFNEALRRANIGEPEYLAYVDYDLRRSHLVDPVEDAAQLPTIAADKLYAYLGERRVADYAVITAASIPEPAAPDEAALKAVYDAHPDAFQAPEYRAVTLLQLSAAHFMDEVDISAEAARQHFEANKAKYQKAEERALRQIIVEDENAAKIALEALKAGTPLEQVAESAKTQIASIAAQSKEELARVLPELAEAAFAVPESERFGMVQTLYGWHVFEIGEIVPGQEVAFEAVQADIVKELSQGAAEEARDSIAGQVDQELSTGTTLDEVSERLNLPLTVVAAIDRSGRDDHGNYVEGLPSPPQLLPQIFESDAGYESLMSQTADGTWYAFRVDDVTPPAARPFDQVKDQALVLWRDQERQRLAETKAADLAEKVNSGQGDLASLAWTDSLEVKQSQPMERQATGDSVPASGLPTLLFEAEVGKAVSTPTPDGALVAVLTQVQAADATADPERAKEIRGALDRGLQKDLISGILKALERTYPVEQNQLAIDEVLNRY
jgi:peptidyl-prolyl cis-trans isomerase D